MKTTDASSEKHVEARESAQLEVQRARDYAEAILETIPPFLILDPELRVKTANQSFYKHFRVSQPQTENCLVYDLGNGQWNIPKLRTFLEEVLPRHSFFKDFEVTHVFETIGRRTLLLSGQQVDHLQRILLLIDDITERVESRSVMRASEIRYRRLFEAARDGILIVDPETRKISDANPFMTELLGYPRAELLGKELWEIGLLKDEEASRAAFGELQQKHYIRYEDLPLQNREGERREVEFVSNRYQENGHEVIQCNIRDITERKRVEEALRQSEQQYRTLFSSIDEGFCVVEMLFDQAGKPFDYRFLELNPSFEKQSGLLQAMGKRVSELVPDFEKHWFEVLGGVALTGEPIRFVNQAKTLKSWFDLYAFRLGGGDSRKVAILFTNITERKRVEDALQQAKDLLANQGADLERLVAERTAQLGETVRDLQAFSYSMSHDMRAPLRAMQGYAQRLLDDYGSKLDEEGANHLQRIMRSAVRLDHLIQDVLTYSKIVHTQPEKEPVDLDKLVRDLTETYAGGQPPQAEIRIQGSLPTVLANEAFLMQCLANLLSNAVKFVTPGIVPRIGIWAEDTLTAADKERPPSLPLVKIFIQDNGIGVAAENHARIFRMFERIHPVSSYEGTGIGLTIVGKAIERMGAQIGFESELGKGSKFWIQLTKG